MAKTIKKVPKKIALKKVVKKVTAKKVVKKIAPKKVSNKIVIRTVLKPTQKVFALEIALLDKLQVELFEGIAQKPQAMDYDEIRLYVDNVYMILNKCVSLSKDVKNALLKKDYKDLFTETYNSPA
jgi:GTPase